MSIGGIDNEAALARFIDAHLAKPGVLPGPAPDVSLIKEGVPTDADFPNTPKNGTTAIDKTGPTRYTRIDGVWKAV